ALLGMAETGMQPMRVALALAPTNRFIVRSASRLFLHAGDPDEALAVIRKSQAAKFDPWLVAAELAVSSVVGKSPKLWKEAGNLVTSKNFAPLHTSELEAAIGSIELWDGRDRRAREHFVNGLTAPSENALAQVVWAARDAGMLQFPFEKVQVHRAFEAEAFVSRNKGDWDTSFERCREWAREEAFSSRPYGLGSGIAASILRKYDDAVDFARGGLKTNPGHPGLQNNIAFALAEAGRPEEAQQELAKVNLDLASVESKACLLATAGLVAYLRGKPDEGKAFYEYTIQFAVTQNKPMLKATAQLYLAREEARAGHPGFEKIFAAGNDHIQKVGDAFAKAIADQINRDILRLRKA
ncbi:MAG: hypothetical protein KDK74_01080, partial [Cephaloticoccus sp.]|nr:hypothetical protein [Cephaloticoccus sp.]